MADVKQQKVKPRNGFVELINALLTLLVLGLLVGGGLFLYGAHSFYAAGPIKADTTFTVQHGANLSAVADQLETQNLIDNRYVFQIGGWVNKKQGALKGSLLYSLACIYAQAAAQTEAELRTTRPALDPRGARQVAQYEQKAARCLRQAMEELPAERRAAFWRDQVMTDPALAALRRGKLFKQLAKEFSQRGS